MFESEIWSSVWHISLFVFMGYGFESCQGLRYLCPTCEKKTFHLYHLFTELEMYHLYHTHDAVDIIC